MLEIGDSTDCCAVQIISELNNYDADPLGAMKAFCKQQYKLRYAGGKKVTEFTMTSAFYIFTAVVRVLSCNHDDDDGCECQDTPRNYGREFAAFIRANDLGPVVQSPTRSNRCNEPNHMVKVWIWCPDQTKLEAWWNNLEGK